MWEEANQFRWTFARGKPDFMTMTGELTIIVCDICLDCLVQDTKLCMSWRFFPVPFYDHCPLNYWYLNLQLPFCCSLAKQTNTMDSSGRVARHAKKESLWLASGDIERSCSLLIHVPSNYCHNWLYSQNITIILSTQFRSYCDWCSWNSSTTFTEIQKTFKTFGDVAATISGCLRHGLRLGLGLGYGTRQFN